VRIDVVVPSAEAGDMLVAALGSLEAQTAPHTTYVVANGAPAERAAAVAERFPDVVVLPLAENDGFGRAVNRGVAAGDGEAVVLLNDDMEVRPDFLERLVAPLEADASVGMVAGLMLVPGSEDLVDAFGIELDPALSAYNRLRHAPLGTPPGRLAVPSGGAVAYRRAAWEQAGGFDPRFEAYGEDVDLGLRLRLAGWGAAEAPDAVGTHLGGGVLGRYAPRQRWLAGFARAFLLRRYGVLRSRVAPRALVLEAFVVGWGLVRHRTLMPVRGRVAGWRAARGERLPVPAGVVDDRITAREALRRLRAG
jgi:N-acetylglucosaminyl-diphospho-decaprenol L-rhamnosyltransferase